MAGQRRVSGLQIDSRAFERGLREALDRIKFKSERNIVELAVDIQNRAKELAAVDTGEMRSKIGHEPGRDLQGFYVDIFARAAHSSFVEFGTIHSSAQPFMRPAIYEAVTRAPRTLRDVS